MNGQLVTFWQDHFYTRDGKWGYPVCIQVQNLAGDKIETNRFLHWSAYPVICSDLVEEVELFIETLDKGMSF